MGGRWEVASLRWQAAAGETTRAAPAPRNKPPPRNKEHTSTHSPIYMLRVDDSFPTPTRFTAIRDCPPFPAPPDKRTPTTKSSAHTHNPVNGRPTHWPVGFQPADCSIPARGRGWTKRGSRRAGSSSSTWAGSSRPPRRCAWSTRGTGAPGPCPP